MLVRRTCRITSQEFTQRAAATGCHILRKGGRGLVIFKANAKCAANARERQVMPKMWEHCREGATRRWQSPVLPL